MTTDPDLLGLLRACKEDVEDDGPRLILADWLQERGDARGEFVRAQVQRHRLPAWDERHTALARREAELLSEHHAAWAGALAERCEAVEFRRGLLSLRAVDFGKVSREPDSPEWDWVERLTFLPMDPVERALRFAAERGISSIAVGYDETYDRTGARDLDSLSVLSFPGGSAEAWMAVERWSLAPRVRALHLTSRFPIEQFRAARTLRRGLRRLDLEFPNLSVSALEKLLDLELPQLSAFRLYGAALGTAGGRRLAGSALTRQLRSLSLWVVRLGTEGFVQLFASPNLANLTRLDVSSERMTVGGIKALANNPHLTNLRDLSLSECQMRSGQVKALAAAPLLGRLERLDLYRNGFGDEEVAVLAASPHLGSLRELNLGYNSWGDEGAASLARSSITDLGKLDVSHTAVGAGGYRALAPWLARQKLVSLNLGSTNPRAAGLSALADCEGLDRLIDLDLSGIDWGHNGSDRLASAPWMRGLASLNLFATYLGVQGLRVLIESGALDRLTTLDVSLGELGDGGARLLAEWQGLAGLCELNLRSNEIGDEGAAAILASPYLTSDTRLHLGNNHLSAGAIDSARERFGARVTFRRDGD
jgi:uncharacterized protein (TIGR02996 family)